MFADYFRRRGRSIPHSIRMPMRRLWIKLAGQFGAQEAWSEFSQYLKANPVDEIFDVGAHIGNSVDEFSWQFPDLNVTAFEPTQSSFEQLSKRFANRKNVRCNQLAISDCTGSVDFFLNSNEQTNSMLDNATGNTKWLAKETTHAKTVSVKSSTIDDFLEGRKSSKIALKLDVQGAERKVLEGAKRSLANGTICVILAEVVFTQLYQDEATFCEINDLLCNRYKFNLFRIIATQSSKEQLLWGDAIWVRSGSPNNGTLQVVDAPSGDGTSKNSL